MTAGRTAVLVVSYGSSGMVLDNLRRTALPDDAVVVVVDNYTTDDERAAIREIASREGWQLVCPEHNLGFGAGMNAAAQRAAESDASAYVLLNPDAYLEGDGVERLSSAVLAEPDAVIAPLVVRPDGGHFSSEMELDLETGSMRRIRDGRRYAQSALWLSGACFAVSRELWERVGGFDDDYFLYWEDVDLSVRAARAGAHLRVDHGVRAVHSAGGTQSEEGRAEGKSAVYYFYNVRNRLVFAAQHLDRAGQRRWTRRAVPAAWEILMRGGRRQLLHPGRTIVPAARGTLSGLAYMRHQRRVPAVTR
ncbi:glycosyltransferase family 2 protein [Microbacterium sp. NPDC057407]|uniref:glycosyltransferase family 2 protein n=1 Tax=Microbacterium sp. NPDC057407 TaxID=3346120 RepID=UPI00367020FF